MSKPLSSQSNAGLNRSAISRRLAFGLLLGFLVFVGVILAGDLRQVAAQAITFRWGLIPPVLALTLVNYSLRFVKFHYYLRQVGVRHLPTRQTIRLFVAGFPLAVTPGKVGEALKGVWINQQGEVPIARGIAVVVAERISDGLAVLLLSVMGVIAYPRYWPAFTLILGGLLGIILISQVRPMALWLLNFSGRLPALGRLVTPLREFYEGSFTLFRPTATFVAVGLGTISWFWEGVGMYLILLGLGVPAGWETLSIAVFVLSFSTVVGAVSALPGGLGAAEASIAAMLVLLLGIQPGTAATATLLIRFATLWFGVSLGFLAWLFSPQLLAFQTTKPQE